MIDRLHEYCDLVKPYALSISGIKKGEKHEIVLKIETTGDEKFRLTWMISEYDSKIIGMDVIEYYLLKMKKEMDLYIDGVKT